MNIKKYRVSRNLTQIELAQKLGVERTTLSMWESNKSNPKPDMLKRLAEALDCTVDELLKNTG